MGKYIKYLVVLFIFFVLILAIEHFNNYVEDMALSTFEYLWVYVVRITGWFVFGAFLGGLNLIYETSKEGTWKINKARLVVLGLPLFLLLLFYGLAHLNIVLPRPIEILIYLVALKNLFKYLAILSGFTLTSSFVKE